MVAWTASSSALRAVSWAPRAGRVGANDGSAWRAVSTAGGRNVEKALLMIVVVEALIWASDAPLLGVGSP